MTYKLGDRVPDREVIPQPWLWQPRPGPITMIEFHATRGNTTPELQDDASLNWVMSPGNVGGRDSNGNPIWGSSFSHVIGKGGEWGKVLDDDQMPTHSAGYGNSISGGFSIDEFAISVEFAQSQQLEAYSYEQYEVGGFLFAHWCLQYDIPPKFTPVFNQVQYAYSNVHDQFLPPRGIVRHDRCENGNKLGKTDPGGQLDENKFVSHIQAWIDIIQEETVADPKLEERVKALEDEDRRQWKVFAWRYKMAEQMVGNPPSKLAIEELASQVEKIWS